MKQPKLVWKAVYGEQKDLEVELRLFEGIVARECFDTFCKLYGVPKGVVK